MMRFSQIVGFSAAALIVAAGMGLAPASLRGQPASAEPAYDGKTVAQWIVELSDLTSGSENKRRRAAYALGRIGPAAKAAVPALVKAVNDPNMEPRWYAVDALGRIGGDAQVAATIAAAIRNPENDVYVRRNAVKALGRLGAAAEAQAEVLVEQLAAQDPATRAGAALALWQVARRGEAIAALKTMLASSAPDEAFAACLALLELRADARAALGELIAALGHASPDVRRAAAKVLGGLGIEAARAIQAEVERPESAVDRAAAAAALGQIVDQVREQLLYAPETEAAAFDQAVQALREVVLPPLEKLLASADEGVRREAGWSLARLGPLAAPPLLSAAQSEDAGLRAGAAEALARMEGYLPSDSPAPVNVAALKPQLVQPLLAAMRSDTPQTRLAAIRAAAALSLGGEAQPLVPLLTAALEDEDAAVRRYAAKALSDIRRG
jgi:HEAT repeat protein